MKLHRAFRYRLYPTKEQETTLAQLGGNARFLYNKLLEIHQETYESQGKTLSRFDMDKLLPSLKQEFPWLQVSYSQSLQQVSRHLADGWKRFFKGQNGMPRFKRKSLGRDSFKYTQNFKVSRRSILLPGRLGRVRMKKHRPMVGKPLGVTISQDGDQWYASILCECQAEIQEVSSENSVGIDLGIKHLAVLSDGSVIENPRCIRKHEKKLKREHRRLSRKQRGSNNRKKQIARLQVAYRKLRNARRDFREKATHHMITKYDGFFLENLHIPGMLKNHALAKAIQDCSWGVLVSSLKQKAMVLGYPVTQIDRWEPSSQLCSACGAKQAMPLNVREYACDACGIVLDRDLNASRNIKKLGRNGLLKEAIV